MVLRLLRFLSITIHGDGLGVRGRRRQHRRLEGGKAEERTEEIGESLAVEDLKL